jgi:hypothetical protein
MCVDIWQTFLAKRVPEVGTINLTVNTKYEAKERYSFLGNLYDRFGRADLLDIPVWLKHVVQIITDKGSIAFLHRRFSMRLATLFSLSGKLSLESFLGLQAFQLMNMVRDQEKSLQ